MFPLGDRLFELRKQKNMSREDAAELLHVDKETLARYERGNRKPQSDFISAAAQVYEVSADYLLGLCASSESKYTPVSQVANEGDNSNISSIVGNGNRVSQTINAAVPPDPERGAASSDLEAALRLRHDRPEVVKLLPDKDFTDDMIRAVYAQPLEADQKERGKAND